VREERSERDYNAALKTREAVATERINKIRLVYRKL